MQNELLNRGLPKWPQMIVTGETLPIGQALEIIRRTDDFFGYGYGNDHEFIRKARMLVGKPLEVEYRDPRCMNADGTVNDEQRMSLLRQYWEDDDKWRQKWGYISTEYVTNSWISCSFVGGPHGWCHPDGTIGYCNNVGKWPDVEEVFKEWELLAQIFPFIQVEVTLMSGEEGEDGIEPVVSFLIRDGKVELVDPAERNLHTEYGRTIMESRDMTSQLMDIFLIGPDREHAIGLEQLEKWGKEHPIS